MDASLETFLTKKRKNKGRGGGVLAGRPTDFNGTGLDASLETFLINLEGGGVLVEKVRKSITKKTGKRKGGRC